MTTFNLDSQKTSDAQEKQAISPSEAQGLSTPAPLMPLPTACNTQPDNSGLDLSSILDVYCIPSQYSETPANDINYEGYQFFKADPIPGQKATWTRVERTRMHLSQGEFYKMVHKRADKISAAQQYQKLSATRRAHVNQLIHERKKFDPSVEWSCVYAKERDRASKARNALRADYETVSMEIILMKRPLNTKPYPRTPMGDLVDLARRQNNEARQITPMHPENPGGPLRPAVPVRMWVPREQILNSDITAASSGVVQGPQPRPVSVTNPFTRLELGQPTPVSSEPQFRPISRQTTTDM